MDRGILKDPAASLLRRPYPRRNKTARLPTHHPGGTPLAVSRSFARVCVPCAYPHARAGGAGSPPAAPVSRTRLLTVAHRGRLRDGTDGRAEGLLRRCFFIENVRASARPACPRVGLLGAREEPVLCHVRPRRPSFSGYPNRRGYLPLKNSRSAFPRGKDELVAMFPTCITDGFEL